MRQKLEKGDFIKCTNCKNYFKLTLCPDCTELHPVEVDKTMVITEVAMKWKLCPHCGTGDQLAHLRKHIRTMQNGMLN